MPHKSIHIDHIQDRQELYRSLKKAARSPRGCSGCRPMPGIGSMAIGSTFCVSAKDTGSDLK